MFSQKTIQIIILSILLFTGLSPSAIAELRIDSVNPRVGKMGEELELMIEGAGFNDNTKVDLHIFEGSGKQIIGSTEKLMFYVTDVAVIGDMAFAVSGENGIYVIDVSAPANLMTIGYVDTPGNAKSVILTDNTAYVADGPAGLQVIDVTDPKKPVIIGSLDTPGEATKIDIADNTAYIADHLGLQVLDITEPSNPSKIKYITMQSFVYDIKVSADTAFVASGEGLVVFDISNPYDPVLTGSLNTAWPATGIQVLDENVFLSIYNSGLLVIDVSDPSLLKNVGSVKTPGYAEAINVIDNTVFIADGHKGLQMIDVSDPFNPYRIGSVDTPPPNYTQGLAVTDNVIYIADSVSLTILPSPLKPNNIQVISDTLITANIPSPIMPAHYSVRVSNETESDILPNAIDYTLEADLIYPSVGKMGENLNVSIHGNGFDANTRISIFPDCSNHHLIISSLETPDAAMDVMVMGDTAFVAAGYAGLQVLDVSDRSDPVMIASLETSGRAWGVAVSGNTAYVADLYGLRVIDVSYPSHPIIIGSVDTPGQAGKVALAGDLAFVADGEGGLQVIDISNPSYPIIIGAAGTPGYAIGVTVALQTVFVGDREGGLQVIDVSDPSSPFIIGTLHTALSLGVAYSDNTLYMAAGDGGLYTINVNDPFDPQIVGSVDMPYTTGIEVADDKAFATDLTARLYIIDVTDPHQPVVEGYVDTPAEAYDVAVDVNAAFVASGDGGLQLIDLSRSLENCIIGKVDTDGQAWDVVVVENTAIVAAGNSGLQVIDLSDPWNPYTIKYLDLPWPNYAQGIALSDTKAFVAAGVEGLHVVDVDDPKSPVIIGHVDTPGSADDVDVFGDIAYIANFYGLQVIDVSDPLSPVIIGSVETGPVRDVSVTENIAFLALGFNGLQQIDVSDPSNPTIIGTLETPGNAYGVAAIDNTVFVADFDSGLLVIDFSDLSNPMIIGSVDTPGLALSVSLMSDIAYVADGQEGLHLIDVSNPSKPMIIESMKTSGRAEGVFVSDQKACVADGPGGISIFQAPNKIDAFEIISDTRIQATIPSPPISGHHSIIADNGLDRDELPGAILFLEPSEYDIYSGDRVIIMAGRNSPGDALWELTRKNANYAYKTLLSRGYTHQAILYLSPETADVDGDGTNDVDLDATFANLRYGFEQWLFEPGSPSNGLIFYMIGHGDTDKYQINAEDMVSASQIAEWIDTVENSLTGRVVVIYDGCLSGSFFDVLVSEPAGNRIVITSTSENEYAAFLNGGEKSFSYRFWSDILEGYRIGGAFSRARAEMEPFNQNALISNETLAEVLYIGVDKFIPAVGPRISRIFPENKTLHGETTATFEVSADSPNGIKSVKAIIIPPDLNQQAPDVPVTDLPVVLLTDPNHDGIYEGAYGGFTQVGTYTITMLVEDMEDLQSHDPDWRITFTQTAAPLQGDVNGDGAVNLGDVITILKTVTENSNLSIQSTAELSGDGRIGIADAIILLRDIGNP